MPYHRIIPIQALLEEGLAPAGVPSASPERRHPRAIRHVRPIHTMEIENVNMSRDETKKARKRITSMAVLKVWICI